MISIKMVVLFHMENVGGFLLLVSFFSSLGMYSDQEISIG
jgi:hypothetical protein